MIAKRFIIELLYFSGAVLFLITGIFLKLTAPSGIGLLLLYSGLNGILWNESGYEYTSAYKNKYIFWNVFFLGLSTIIFFSLTKVLFNILVRDEVLNWNSLILLISVLGIIYFEILFRISSQKKSRFAALVMLLLFILSTGAFIFGDFWLKTDFLMGFLSLTVTVIISFRKTYIGLSELLEKNRDKNER
ncbi:MAG: hypothetical protein PF693_17610 [Spirochaetia bacterium]|jgi:hypothetical protein|nr:hypothetical protein [Spirochaetia bacterium]